jgi:hypothetical protein
MRKVFPVETVVKPREPECIQWSPLQSNMVITTVGPMCLSEVLGSEPRPNELKRCLSFKVEVQG